MSEQEKFNQWWESKGVNSVILRAQAWSAWLARAEAEQPQPAEDPDEWVILDSVNYANHVPRIGVDEFSTGNGRWQTQKEHHCNGTVAYWKAHEDLIHRCRRRDLPKVEQVRTESESDHVPDATKKISDEALELIVHLRDQMESLSKRVTECERLLKKPDPQPQKTQVRLWMRNEPKGRPSVFACDERPYPDLHKYIEIHHDSEGFYVEGGQS